MKNPLLEYPPLPAFTRIKPEHVEAAVDQVLTQNREAIATLLQQDEHSWESLIQPLEQIQDRLHKTWSPVSHLNSVMNNEALRDAHNACLPKLSQYATELGQNTALFQAYQRLHDSDTFSQLSQAQQKVINDALRDFRLSGVDLPETEKNRFKEIQQQLSTLKSQFSDNVLDATQAWSFHTEQESDLAGLPPSAIDMAAQTAQSRNQRGWVFNLEFPSYFAIMTYADRRELRQQIYKAYVTRASDQGPNAGQFDNSRIMQQILELRTQKAHLLGYANYAELSLATKMAPDTQSVLDFLSDLAKRSRPIAEQDLHQLQDFATQEMQLSSLEPWDIMYLSEKLRQKRYNVSQEDLKPYFPEPQVVQGMFAVVHKLYGLSIEERHDVDTWHEQVRFFDVKDPIGQLRGRFYMDLYARANKRGGAWMDECASRFKTKDGIQTPVAFITCNFTPPSGGKPALLTHSELTTLFHEFGHGLHHMLTQIDCMDASGINGVPWDAVELPSQFMENWCWEKESLNLIARHYESGEPLPDSLFDKLLQAKNFQSAMQMVRQLEFALFDFRLHLEFDPQQPDQIQNLLNQVRREVAVIRHSDYNRFQHGFSHIFAGGYAAGYYSYKWAEVLSADAFSKFEEDGIFNRDTGQAFLHSILEQGGSAEPMELFKQFRGREPSVDALLRHSGITA
ncbi:MAG: oligopeptidase A [Gammaproteobacteria bacterium]|nr:oligopeptidase A [Gammaproteobacteria bacterium]MDH5800301.1 oligopeptidase A [Gammaproteobacteria bacterium]